MTEEDHQHRIQILETGLQGVVQQVTAMVGRVANVERKLDDIGSDSGRAHQRIIATVDGLTAAVARIVETQTMEAGTRAGLAQAKAISDAEALLRQRAADQRQRWIFPVFAALATAIIGGITLLIGLGVTEFIQQTPHDSVQIDATIEDTRP